MGMRTIPRDDGVEMGFRISIEAKDKEANNNNV